METNIFDIETKPFDENIILQNADPFDPTSVRIGNLKDEAKIEAKIKASEKAYTKQLLDKAALDPHTSSICAIGINLVDSNQVIHLCEGTEIDILNMFWDYYRQSNHKWAFWSGSNNKEYFDPRHIIVRSWKQGVSVPWGVVSQGGWLNDRFLDLSQIYLFGTSYPSYCSADNAAKQLALLGKESGCGVVQSKIALRDKGVEGKNFHKVLEHDRQLALQYLTNDVAMERAIANRIL